MNGRRLILVFLSLALSLSSCRTLRSITPFVDTYSCTMEDQLDSLAQELAEAVAGENKTSVAVVAFRDLDGRAVHLGKYMAEELTTRLHSLGTLQVIERRLLGQIIKEQELTASGIISDSSARSIGQILGVSSIALGSIADLGVSVRVNARLISTETGAVYAVATGTVCKDPGVIHLLHAGRRY